MTRVAKAKSTAVVTQDFAKELEDLRGRLAAPSGDKIKVDNKQFKLPNGDTSDLLTGIIVDFVYYNAYYDAAFDPNNITPPTCFAIHPDPSGATPSPNSLKFRTRRVKSAGPISSVRLARARRAATASWSRCFRPTQTRTPRSCCSTSVRPALNRSAATCPA